MGEVQLSDLVEFHKMIEKKYKSSFRILGWEREEDLIQQPNQIGFYEIQPLYPEIDELEDDFSDNN